MNSQYISEIKQVTEGQETLVDIRDSRIPEINSQGTQLLKTDSQGYIIPISIEAGNGIDISLADYINISHANTSDQDSIEERTNYFISSIVLDNFGHITQLKVKKEQDITNKADKATTLAGYDIRDAYIENNGVIHLGNQTITPITQHQSLSGYATENWVTDKQYQNESQVNIKINNAVENLAAVAKSGEYSDLKNLPSLNFLPLTGGELRGDLILNGTPVVGNQAANKKYVDDIASSISGIQFLIVEELPLTGSSSIMYLVKQGTSSDIYDQYVWISSESRYQHIGSTAVDLSNYLQKPANPTQGQVLQFNGNSWIAQNPPDTGLIYTETVVEDQTQKDIKQNNISKVSDIKEVLGVNDLSYIKYSEVQSLTPSQKQIAQTNIGIDGFVKYTESQNLSINQKTTAQTNIGANTILGTQNPTTLTEGVPGQHYKLTVEPYAEYVCISIDNGVYNWKNVNSSLMVSGHTLYGPGLSVTNHKIISNY